MQLHMPHKPLLSIVVPVFNEEKRLENGITSIINYLKKQKYDWEVIVIDDGSWDETLTLTKQLLRKEKRAKIISGQHLGKGGAIKQGVLFAQGNYMLFMDIDLATPIEELDKFIRLKDDHDVLIGSRKMQGSRVLTHQPAFREFGGKIFTLLTNLLVTKNITDVTCGFKLFKTDVAQEIFSKAKLTDWSFDAEVLFLAQKKGFSILQIPVNWKDDPNTKVKLLSDTFKSFMGILKIRYFNLMGYY